MSGALAWPKSVRVAGYDDEAAIFDILMALYRDNGVGIPPRPQDVREAIRAGTRNGKETYTLIGVIDDHDGTLAGTVCITVARFWYNQADEHSYLAERWLFVRPEARKGHRYFDDLIQCGLCYQRQLRDATGWKWPLISSVTSFKRLAAKMRLWGRKGRQVGAIYEVGSNAPATVADANKSEAA